MRTHVISNTSTLLEQIIRSIAVEDERHVMHLPRRKTFDIYISVHLTDVQTDLVYVRICFHRWKEKLLSSKADNENCDDGDDVMCAHEWHRELMIEPVRATSAKDREYRVDRFVGKVW